MYGKLLDGGLVYASKKAIVVDDVVITNPKHEDYIRAGYKKIINNPPEDADKEYEPYYTETETEIIINYREV